MLSEVARYLSCLKTKMVSFSCALKSSVLRDGQLDQEKLLQEYETMSSLFYYCVYIITCIGQSTFH